MKIWIALLAIIGMLAWIALWGWVALANWTLVSRLQTRGWTMATRLKHTTYKSMRHFWHPEYIVRGIAAVLVVLAVIFFAQGMNATDEDDQKFARNFAPNLATDCLSLAVTILVIDQLYRWRDKDAQQRIDESLAAHRKRNIIQQMASLSNDFALDAARIAKNEGWLEDGSLEGAHLFLANLEGADLRGANLQGADLGEANLEGADLFWANLEGANLFGANLQSADLFGAKLEGANFGEANLQGADLGGAKLEGADLRGAKLQGAKYDADTIWPDGFDRIATGVILIDQSFQMRDKAQ